jgi:hypothetical protein
MARHRQPRSGGRRRLASFLLPYVEQPIIPLLKGVFTMPECMVAIDQITYYAVQAEDEVTASDLVLEGQGLELDSATRDASITEDQSRAVQAVECMNIIHDFNDNDSLDFCMTRDDIIYQAVGRSDRTLEKMAAHKEDIIMHTHGHTTVWGTPIGIGRARDTKSLYQQLRDWWAAHKAARREARLASLHACWDSTREVVTPFRADAASEMAAAQHALSVATMLYGLSE